MADRVLIPGGSASLASTCHYDGPVPARVGLHLNLQAEERQLHSAAPRLKQQVRVYAGNVGQGDRIGLVFPRKVHPNSVLRHLSRDPILGDFAHVVKAGQTGESDYDPKLDANRPICILTVKGCKRLEFRTVHWLFADDLSFVLRREDYYTVITRAKTSLDIYSVDALSETVAGAYSEQGGPW